MKLRLSLLYPAVFTSTIVGCSQGPAEIAGTEWRCDKQNNERECSVSFIAENQSHLPAESIIRIRAHRRQHGAEGAIQNNVVGDKVLHVTLDPGEKRQYSETLKPISAVTHIVVTISSKEK